MKKIFYGKHHIDNSDVKSVIKVLKSDFLTKGPEINKLEQKLSKKLNVKYVSVCNSGTAALHLSLLAIDLKKNDYVVMPAINFIASYNLCKSMGAKIILIDVDELSGQMIPNKIIKKIKSLKNVKIKAIINMMHGGYPQYLKEMHKLKNSLKCHLIDDSCHALGAEFKFKDKVYKIGSCKLSDLSTFSLHPVKSITAGEGGIVTTNNKKFYQKIVSFKEHGLERDKKKYWDYKHSNYGFNYRLSEINSALALSQLNKLDKFVKERKRIANFYLKKLSLYKEIKFPNYELNNKSSYHLFLIHLNFEFLKNNKDYFIKYLNSKKIYPQFHYKPIYRLDNDYRFKKKEFAGSEKYYESALSLPIYYGLKFKEQIYIIRAIINFLKFNKKNV